MNRNRCESSGQRSIITMGNVVHPEDQPKRQVEISDDEDDEVQEISEQGTSNTSDRATRLSTRRQRRDATLDLHFSRRNPEDEEWTQLQEVLLISKREAEQQEERRKMCGTLEDVMNLQVEIEPLSSGVIKSLTTETSPDNKSEEQDQRDTSASPDLFSSLPEDQEHLSSLKDGGNIEFPSSPPIPVTSRSPDSDRRDRNGNVSTLTDQREETERKRPKLRRTRREIPNSTEQNDKEFDNEIKATSFGENEEQQDQKSMDGEGADSREKRKLQELDEGDTDEEDIPLRTKLSLKRKKLSVLEDTSDVEDGEVKTSKRILGDIDDPQPKRVAVDQETATNGQSSLKRKEPFTDTWQQRTSPNLLHMRLSRGYKKPRALPSTLKEAVRSNLYFAPQGFNLSTYTGLIIRMFEKYKQRLHLAQSRVRTRIPWGVPVVCGKSQGKTLDALLPGRTFAVAAGKSSVFVRGTPRMDKGDRGQFDQGISHRRRTLRSSTVNQVPSASTSTSESSREVTASCKVDSDSDSELMTSCMDKMMPSSGTGSAKKAQESVKSDNISGKVFEEACKLATEGLEEQSVTKQTSADSDVVVTDNDATSESPFSVNSAGNDPGSGLFGVDVVLDSENSETKRNGLDSLNQTLENENQVVNESKTNTNGLDSEFSGSRDEGSKEASNDTDGNLSEIIRPPKRRSFIRPLDDDSTDDESVLSQPVFSLSLPRDEASATIDTSVKEKASNEFISGEKSKDILDFDIPIDSQSVLTECESQGVLGKSVLETMATDGETLLPSQALTDTQSSSLRLLTKTLQEVRTTGLASSSVGSTADREEKRSSGDEEFMVDVDSDDSQHVRQKRSEAAEKAVAAAMKRQQTTGGGGDPREASSSNSTFNNPDQSDKVECPLCYERFTAKEIEVHASDCQGPSSSTQASHSRIQNAGRSVTSSPSRAKPKLKNLKVVLERSPLAKEKLLQRAIRQTDSAKKNLDFEENLKSSVIPDRYVRPLASSSRSFNQDSRTRGGKKGAAVRSDSESELSVYEHRKEDEGSSAYSWIDSTSPQPEKPQRTYGGNSSKLPDSDFLPLDTEKDSDYDELFKSTFSKAPHADSKPAISARTEEIESNSDSSSDDNLMVQYGAQRISSRRRTQRRQAEKPDLDKNEQALEKIGSGFKKRPRSLSKSSKAKKARRRTSDSASDESDELTIVCHLCSKKIPKELYEKHAEEELEERKRSKKVVKPTEEVVIVKEEGEQQKRLDQRRVSRRIRAREDTPPSQSSGTEQRDTEQNENEIDWDAVSNSPIKCFQFTENSSSAVDFENQFEHLKKSKRGGRRGNSEKYGGSGTRRGHGQFGTREDCSNSGSRGEHGDFGNMGRYRGSYKKVYGRGRGKNYGRKFRGYRGKK